MKKQAISLVLLILVLSPVISAIELTISKDSYQPQEIFQAEFNGNFLDTLQVENINFYKQDIPRSIPLFLDLTKQGENYYLYAILPNQEGNFSIQIEGVRYTELGEIKTESIIKNFTIARTNESALKIEPGFIVTSDNFSIKLTSLYGNIDSLSLKLEATKETKNVSLIEGIEKKVDFYVPKQDGKTNLKIILSTKTSGGGWFSRGTTTETGYNIPIFVFSKPQINETAVLPNKRIDFNPSQIKGALTAGTNFLSKIVLENIGNETVTNLDFSSDLTFVTIKPNAIDSLRAGQKVTLNVSIPIDKKTKTNISGKIIASFDSQTKEIPVFFEIITKQEEVNLSGTGITETLSCSEIGALCDYDADETCDGETTTSLEGQCCLGSCKEVSKSRIGLLFGILIVVVVVLALGYLYFKAKRKQKPKSTEDILSEKSRRFEDRMKGKEISGGLGNI